VQSQRRGFYSGALWTRFTDQYDRHGDGLTTRVVDLDEIDNDMSLTIRIGQNRNQQWNSNMAVV